MRMGFFMELVNQLLYVLCLGFHLNLKQITVILGLLELLKCFIQLRVYISYRSVGLLP